jgi:hypothetical protein
MDSLQGSGCRPVYLIVTPLQCYTKYRFNRVDIYASRCQNNRIPFGRLQHWAVQVGDHVNGEMYEVTSYGIKGNKRKLKFSSAEEWRTSRNLPPRRKLFITVTDRSTAELESIAYSVWDAVLEDEYRAMSRNCQSFAELFKAIIEDRELLTEEASTELDDMPGSFNPFYAFLHLKRAKHAAARWTRRVFRRDSVAGTTEGNASPIDGVQQEARLPGKKTDRWLELVNQVSKQREFRGGNDVRGIVQRANRLRQAEKRSGPISRRRFTWS